MSLFWRPLDAPPSPRRVRQNPWSRESRGLWNDLKTLRWVVVPCEYLLTQTIDVNAYWRAIASSLKLLLIPIVLWSNWELLSPFMAKGLSNPFTPLLFISHKIPTSSLEGPRYQKGYYDLVFVAYHIIFWSFFRQSVTIYICRPVANWFGIKKEGKLDRFGEQAYAVIYFTIMGLWGLVSLALLNHAFTCWRSYQRIMAQLPTWWYKTEHFWLGMLSSQQLRMLWFLNSTQATRIGIWYLNWNATTWCNLLTGVNNLWFLCWDLRNLERIITSLSPIMLSPCGSSGNGLIFYIRS